MIEINFNLKIINSITPESLQMKLDEAKINYEIEDDEFTVNIDSIALCKKINAIIAKEIVDIKWDECFEDAFEEVFNEEYDKLLDSQKRELEEIKNCKRLEILVRKTVEDYLSIQDNETINFSSFLMFNMDGFEDYLKNELKNVTFETIKITDELKADLIKEWIKRGIYPEDYKTLFVLKNGNSYALFNSKKDEITYEKFTKEMGFEIENANNIKNENSKYLTIILNISSYLGTSKIYIDQTNCEDLANLLVSNISFDGNNAQIALSSFESIKKMMDLSIWNGGK